MFRKYYDSSSSSSTVAVSFFMNIITRLAFRGNWGMSNVTGIPFHVNFKFILSFAFSFRSMLDAVCVFGSLKMRVCFTEFITPSTAHFIASSSGL